MIGIIAAMAFEKDHIGEMIQVEEVIEKYGIKYSVGRISKNPVVVAACGEGKVNAARCAQTMICLFDVAAIINVGVAGSMSSHVKRGEIVIADKVVQHDYDMSPIGFPVGLVPLGERSAENPWGDRAAVYTECSEKITDIMRAYMEENGIHYHFGGIATGDVFVADREMKERILSNFDVLACEMEGAAIAHVCRCAGVDFAEIRDISDNADESADDYYWTYRQKYSLSKMLYEILCGCEEL